MRVMLLCLGVTVAALAAPVNPVATLEELHPTRIFGSENTPKGLEIRAVALDGWGRSWVATAYGIWLFDGLDFYPLRLAFKDDAKLRAPDVDWLRIQGDTALFPWGAGRVVRFDVPTQTVRIASESGWQALEATPPKEDIAHRAIWCELPEGVWSAPLQDQVALRWTDFATGRQTNLVFPVASKIRRALGCEGRTVALLMDEGRLVVAHRGDNHALTVVSDIDLSRLGIKEAGKMKFLRNFGLLDEDHALVVATNGLFKVDLKTARAISLSQRARAPHKFNGVMMQRLPSGGRRTWLLSESNSVYELDETSFALRRHYIPSPEGKRRVDFASLTETERHSYLWTGASEELALTTIQHPTITAYRPIALDHDRDHMPYENLCMDSGHHGWYTNEAGELFDFERQSGHMSKVNRIADRVARLAACDSRSGIWAIENDKQLIRFERDAQGRLRRNTHELPTALHGKANLILADGEKVWMKTVNSLWTFSLASEEFHLVHEFQGQIIRLANGDARAQIRLMVSLRAGNDTKKTAAVLADGSIVDGPPTPEEVRNFRFHPMGRWVAMSGKGSIFSLPAQLPVPTSWRTELEQPNRESSYDRCFEIAPDGTLWFTGSQALWSWQVGHKAAKRFGLSETGFLGTSNEMACSRTADNRLLFAHNKGWLEVDPKAERPPALLRAPRLSAWSTHVQPWTVVVGEEPPLELPEDSALLRLRMHVPGELDGGNLHWRFRVVGLETPWRPARRTSEIELSGLPANIYSVEVQASRDATEWSPSGSISLTVVPPWYKSRLARTVGALLLISLVTWRLHAFKRLQRQRAQELAHLAESDRRVNLALWASGDVIWGFDLQRRKGHLSHVPWLSLEANQALGAGALLGQWVHTDDLPQLRSAFRAMRRGKLSECRLQFRMQGLNGDWVWVEARGRPSEQPQDPQASSQIGGTLRNISLLRATQDRLHHLAMHDVLTGLPNRRHWENRIAQALNSGKVFTVLMTDIDRFKYINDSLGHGFGDRILVEVAARVMRSLSARSPDVVLARIAGDEFAALLPGVRAREAQSIANSLVTEVSKPMLFDGVELVTTLSVGLACYPEHGLEASMLQAAMDVALHQAKTQGRNGTAVYDSAERGGIVQRMHMETALQLALSRGEFEVVYQPKLEFRTSRWRSVEALLRWRSEHWPDNDIGAVIEILESSHLIHEVGLWVLQQATTQLAQWRQQGLVLDSVAINVSSKQLARAGFVQSLRDILVASNLQPSDIEIEITESVLIPDSSVSKEQLESLHQLGVKLAIDDFGKGYSSLERLQSLPFEVLKIDKRFIDDIDVDDDKKRFCRHLVNMMRDMGLQVVAEGVEREQQLEALVDMGTDAAQGFFISKPVSGPALFQLLSAQLGGTTKPAVHVS